MQAVSPPKSKASHPQGGATIQHCPIAKQLLSSLSNTHQRGSERAHGLFLTSITAISTYRINPYPLSDWDGTSGVFSIVGAYPSFYQPPPRNSIPICQHPKEMARACAVSCLLLPLGEGGLLDFVLGCLAATPPLKSFIYKNRLGRSRHWGA